MSGAEALAVLGAISAVISIIGATKQVYDTASDQNGLRQEAMMKDNVDEGSCKAMKPIIAACGDKAGALQKIFNRALPNPTASRAERYWNAVKTSGKGDRVELLMKGMLEDVQLLASDYVVQTATQSDMEELSAAIQEVSAIPPSIDDEKGTVNNIISGSGTLTVHMSLFRRSRNEEGFGNWSYLSSKIEDDCLASLAFPNLGFYQRSIQKAQENTCKWLLEDQKYMAWAKRERLDDHFGLLWVKGNMGAEKSTLMNEAYLKACRQDSDAVVAGYFALRKGSELERSKEGFVRTVLIQILRKHRTMLTELVRIYETRRGYEEWTTKKLLEFMEHHLIRSGGTAFYIFIDGLDEGSESDARDLVSYFRKLTLSASTSGAKVNVCLSSKYYPNIEVPRCQEIAVESKNRDDIRNYTNVRLFRDRRVESTFKESFAKDVIARSSGSFLWTVLVVAQLNEDFDKGREETTMRDRVVLNPAEINVKYAQLFEDVDARDTEEILRFWRCIIFAARPLSLVEFQHMFAFGG
ncbi:hypothetical protein PSPO01_16039 [Paraphaeosphaeria sporulosa]